MTGNTFQKRFLALILLTWVVPPVFGLSVLVYIQMFTLEQMIAILVSPIEPVFILGSMMFALWYFNRYAKPVYSYLKRPSSDRMDIFLHRLRLFPLHFWGIFLVYLLIAPITVIISAEWYSDFRAMPIDWFRINLVALIVSIIVGLPIFFRILDLFGQHLKNTPLTRPHVTLKVKVFLIGALVPLLVDTMLVQYYWTRTGYFTFETFIVWLTLEVMAIVGSLIFVKSISQSLQPLSRAIEKSGDSITQYLDEMVPQSTDELGVLTTNYRKLLQKLKGYHQSLERLVAKRTGELEASNKELESFCSSVSHDLRAPLRSIKGFSQAIIEDYKDHLDEQGTDYLHRITENITQMNQLIDDLLALSRITIQETKLEQVNLSAMAAEIIEALKQAEHDRHVDVEIESSLIATGDNTLLKIALDNLFSNAWKYTRKSSPGKIHFGYSEKKQAYYVTDNGVGFDMKYAGKLFEAFQRLHSAEDFEGTGVGLTTVQRIINRHQGEIWAESKPGTGTTFYFTIGTAAPAKKPMNLPSSNKHVVH
ncbi:MAG: ATP-binding protein [Gammaproteobacteria bacterium]